MDEAMLMGGEAVYGTMYLGKADAKGNLLWTFADGTKQAGPTATDRIFVNDLAVSDDGSVWVAGLFDGFPDFGDQPLSQRGGPGAFVARFLPDGTLAWSQAFDAIGSGEVADLTPLPGGDMALIGNFWVVDQAGVGNQDIGIVRLNASGLPQWAQLIGGVASAEIGSQIGYDRVNDRLLIAGRYFDPFSFGSTALSTGATNANYLLGKIDASDGAVIDAIGWTDWEFGGIRGIATNHGPSGGAYVAGYFTGSLSYLGETLTDVHSGGARHTLGDGFLALDSAAPWLRQMTGPSQVFTLALAADDNGNAYVAGGYLQEVTISSGVTYSGTQRFVAKFDDSGNLLASATMGVTFTPDSLAVSQDSAVYIGGAFTDKVTFGGQRAQRIHRGG